MLSYYYHLNLVSNIVLKSKQNKQYQDDSLISQSPTYTSYFNPGKSEPEDVHFFGHVKFSTYPDGRRADTIRYSVWFTNIPKQVLRATVQWFRLIWSTLAIVVVYCFDLLVDVRVVHCLVIFCPTPEAQVRPVNCTLIISYQESDFVSFEATRHCFT